jgi:hypothetical protein
VYIPCFQLLSLEFDVQKIFVGELQCKAGKLVKKFSVDRTIRSYGITIRSYGIRTRVLGTTLGSFYDPFEAAKP